MLACNTVNKKSLRCHIILVTEKAGPYMCDTQNTSGTVPFLGFHSSSIWETLNFYFYGIYSANIAREGNPEKQPWEYDLGPIYYRGGELRFSVSKMSEWVLQKVQQQAGKMDLYNH